MSNNIIKLEPKPLSIEQIMVQVIPAKKSDVLDIVAILSDGFPSQQRDAIGTANRNKAFLVAADGYPLDAVRAACEAFMKGKVEAMRDKAFMPSSAQFADEIEKQFWKIQYAKRKAAEPKPEPVRPISLEHKKKMLGRFGDLKKKLAAINAEAKLLETTLEQDNG